MNCNEARTQLERRLPADAPDPAATLHLVRCPDCRAHAAALALVDRRLGALHARLDAPADFGARLSARIAQEQQRRLAVPDRTTVEREFGGSLHRLRRETLLESGGLLAGGIALAVAAWHLAPETGPWFAQANSLEGLLVIGGVSAAATLGAAWLAMGGAWRSLVTRAR